MKKYILSIMMLAGALATQAQEAPTAGFLLPRMTTAQKTAMVNPAKGLTIYNTDTNAQEINTGTAAAPVWSVVSAGSATVSKFTNDATNTRVALTNLSDGTTARPAGTEFVISDAGKFGIGNTVPLAKLDLSDVDGQTYYPTTNGVGLVLNVTGSSLNTSGSTSASALSIRAIATDDITKTVVGAATISSETPSTGTINYTTLYAGSSSSVHRNSNTLATSRAMSSLGRNTSTGTVTSQVGSYNSSANELAGTVTNSKGSYNAAINTNAAGISNNMYGSESVIQNNGTNENAYAGSFTVNLSNAATTTNAYGINTSIIKSAGAIITNGYGIYVGGISAANKYAIYTADAGAPSYFAGKVGIGTTTPSGTLGVLSSGFITFDRSPSYMNLLLRSAGGTTTAPTAITIGSTIGRLTFDGHDGTAWRLGGSAYVNNSATENWSPAGVGSKLTFATTPNGTLMPVDRLAIENNGNVGIGTSNPTEKLEVNGAIKIGSTSAATPTAGTIRFNSTTSKFEGYDGTAWVVFH